MTIFLRLTRVVLPPLLAILLCPFLGCSAKGPEEEKAPPAPVKWETPRLLVLEEWTELVGTTQPLPDRVAFISAPVEARVMSLPGQSSGAALAEGQHVDKGQEIAHLDDRVLLANRTKLQAGEEELQAQISVAESAVAAARLDLDRLKPLEQSGSSDTLRQVSRVDLPKAQIAMRGAQAQYQAAEAKLLAAKKELAALDEQLKLYALKTPIAGRLGRIHVALGQAIAVGTLVAEVIDLDDQIDVLCFVPPGVARRLSIDQSARIGGFEKDSPAGADPEGKIIFIAQQAEAETGNLAVKVRFPNKDAKLKANTTIRVRVLTKPGKECFAIPEAALMEDQDPPGVVVVEEVETKKNEESGKDEQLGKARRLQAIVGIRDRVLHQVEIIRLEDKEKKWSGDLEHALIVIEKGLGLQTGDKVRFEEEEEEE